MKIVIWGAGAVGLGLASALATSEDALRILGRNPETLDALARRGLARSGLFGTVHVDPDRISVVADPATLDADPPDWILVCTKAFASGEIARALESRSGALRAGSRLLLCQNGWGNERPFLSFWPKERLYHARIITGFHLRAPNEVEITAHAAPIALGSLFGAELGSLETLARHLELGGLPAETSDDMRGLLWEKMLYNCALNPLGAIAGRRYGELVDDPTTRALLEAVVAEIFRVLDAAEVRLRWTDAEAYLATFHADLIPPTAAHESSMLQDLRAGRRTEIEALCGAVERLAGEVGVATPVVSSLAELVRAVERAPKKGPPPEASIFQLFRVQDRVKRDAGSDDAG